MASKSLGSLTDFAEFATARLPHLLGYAHALTGDCRLAEDLVQEALVRTGLAWDRVRRKDRPDRYVKTAIVRLYLNQRRDDRRMVLDPDPDSSTMERGFTRVEEHDSLRRALTRVPRRMRAVLVLRYLEGLSDEEIAEFLRCSRGTVRSQAARGLMKLREAYESGVGTE